MLPLDNDVKRLNKCNANKRNGLKHVPTRSILPHHLAVVAEFFIIIHFVNCHAVRLRGDVAHLVSLFGVVVHGTLAIVASSVFSLAICVEKDT